MIDKPTPEDVPDGATADKAEQWALDRWAELVATHDPPLVALLGEYLCGMTDARAVTRGQTSGFSQFRIELRQRGLVYGLELHARLARGAAERVQQ